MFNFLTIGFILLVAGILFELSGLYYLAYIFGITGVLLKVYYWNLEHRLVLEHGFRQERIFTGEETECRLRLNNRGWLPIFWLKYEEILPSELYPGVEQGVINLPPGTDQTVNFTLKGRKRGYYRLGPLSWEVGDPLGYRTVHGYLEESEPLIIYPKVVSLAELGLPTGLPYGNRSWPRPVYKDPTRVQGIRDYQPGDRLNRIHWKASAKTGKLQVKKYESTVSLESLLMLNMSSEDYGLESLEVQTNLAVTVAASLANYFHGARHPYSLLTNGRDPLTEGQTTDFPFIPLGKGDYHLQLVMELLARLQVSKDEGFLSLLTGPLKLGRGGTVVIITAVDSPELLARARGLLQRGLNVKIIVVGGPVQHKQYTRLPYTSPLTVNRVKKAGELHEL